jgi:mannonate dehydratase
MKLGLGLYKNLLNSTNFQFAKQAGATHLVVQLVDYVKGTKNPSLTKNYLDGWGVTYNRDKLWQYEDLMALKKEIESHGLKWEAIENFDPAHWYDILLDGLKRKSRLKILSKLLKWLAKLAYLL